MTRTFKTKKEAQRAHSEMTDEHGKKFWGNVSNPYPLEENINIEEMILRRNANEIAKIQKVEREGTI